MTQTIKNLKPYRVQTTDGQITDDCRTRDSALQAAAHRARYMQERFEVWRFDEEAGWHKETSILPF